MQGLRLNVTEQLYLFLLSIGIFWVSDHTPTNKTETKKQNLVETEKRFYKKEKVTQDTAQFSYAKKQSYRILTSNLTSQIPIEFPKAHSANIVSKTNQTSKNNKTKNSILSPNNVAESRRGWYYELQLKISGPLLLTEQNENYFRENNQASAIFKLESPYHNKLGRLQIRGQVPIHLFWQTTSTTAYPNEIMKLLPDKSQIQVMQAVYHSNLYLRWEIPKRLPLNKNYQSAYLQIGSIEPRYESLWHMLGSATPFPGSKQSLAYLPKPSTHQVTKQGQPLAKTLPSLEYKSDGALGQNIGLSWDGRFVQALLLHQRNSYEQHLSTGLALRLDYLPKRPASSINSRPATRAVQNIYRIRAASLLSQNLSRPDNDSSWYFDHLQLRQNSHFYQAEASQRWNELLRYDTSVKQFYFQLAWKHNVYAAPGKKQNSYFQLGLEQAASVSPLDYWGSLQRYYFKFQFPIFKQSINYMLLNNEFYATYSDANWIDSRRRLASSTVSQWYGQRLNLQNQLSLYFQQKSSQQKTASSGSGNSSSASISQTSSKRHQQILRLNSGAKTIQLFHNTQSSYWNLGADNYWLWYSNRKSFKHLWHLMLGVNLYQTLPAVNDIRLQLRYFPTALWQGFVTSSLGWQQQPPTRKPQLHRKIVRTHRLGWKTKFKAKATEENLEQGNLEQASIALSLFFQIWNYGQYSRQKNTTGWWKFFQLQWELGLQFLLEQSTYLILQTKLQAHFQLAKHWSILFTVKLNEWQKTQETVLQPPKTLKLELSLCYQFQSSKDSQISLPQGQGNIEQDIPGDDPLKEFNNSFELE